jgi:hypothetical protein
MFPTKADPLRILRRGQPNLAKSRSHEQGVLSCIHHECFPLALLDLAQGVGTASHVDIRVKTRTSPCQSRRVDPDQSLLPAYSYSLLNPRPSTSGVT